MKNSVIVRAVAALAVAGAALVAVPAQANPAGTGVVIHEIYVNGGSANATYRNKFVELRNPTDTKVDLNGWSIQYRSASGVAAFSGVTALGDHHIEPGGTFVISGNSNAANGAMLPTPDVAGSIGFSGSSGTIALSTSTTPLTGTPDVVLADSNLVDLIGYGGSLTFETAVKSSGTSVTSSLNRTNAADTDTDTDNNSTDFTAGSPLPQPCGAACEGSGVPEEPPVVKTIAQIQGTGAASPIIGTNVTTRGVVTAVYPTGGFDGAYIQTEGTGGALDLGTHTASDGVFVFSSELAAGVDKGDFVEVTGKVTEFGGLTEVTTSTGAFSVLDETPDVVRAAAVTIPSSATTRESLEGMLLAPQGDYTVTNNYTTNRFAEVGLADGDTPLDTPTNVVAPGVQATALQTQNNARLITLDDGASIDFTGASNQGIALPWLTPDNEVRVGAPVDFDDPVVLDFRFGWKLQPTGRLLAGGDEPVTFGDTRSAAPKPVGGDVRIGTFNVLNYFSTTGAEYTGGICSYYKDRQGNPITVNSCTNNGPRGAADEASFQRQQAKIVTAINTLDANVVSLEEVENSINLGLDRDTALSDLTDALNGAAGEERWAFVPSPADVPAGEDVIRTAFIYQPDVVTPVGASRILIGASAFDNAREPLAQTFRLTAGSAASAFAVVVNHFKSKGSSGLPQDNDQGDGQGASNYSRTLQAAALVTFAQDFAGDAGTSRVFLAGDFNSYNEEDPLKIIEDAGYVNVPRQLTHKETYQFGGQIGSLDHVFASADAFSRVTGADIWNINAYESLAREYSRFNANVTDFYRADQYRASDHDPEIIGFDAEPTASTVAATTSPSTFGEAATVQATVASAGATSGTVTVSDGGVELASAPVAAGAATITLPATLAAGSHSLTVTYGGNDDVGAAQTILALSIAKASTTTRATAPQSERFGKDIMVKTAVSSSTGTTPTGDVTLTEGPASLDARALADGTVTLTAEALSIGKHRLTATFAGDANHTGSTTTVEVTILRGVQPITATVKSSTYGTSAVMHVTGPAGAAGTVYVGNGNDVVGAGTMTGGAASILLDKTLLPGTYDLDVYYGGDASFEPATTSVDLTVDRATTALTKGTSTSRIVVNATRAKVRFTVTAPGFTVAGGTVRVYSGTTLVGKGTVVRGRATARMSRFTSTGTKTLVAKYSGNAVAKESTRSFTLKVVRR